MHRRLALTAVAALALGAAACSSTSSSSSTTTKPIASTTTSAKKSSTTTSATTTTAKGPVTCTTKILSISAGQSNGAAGHIYVPIVFKNTSSSTCSMSGFPGVAATNSSGVQVAQAARATPPSPSTINVDPGASASALVVGVDVPSGTETSCTNWSGLVVTPPNDTGSVSINVQLPSCSGFSVHAVVAGATGGQ